MEALNATFEHPTPAKDYFYPNKAQPSEYSASQAPSYQRSDGFSISSASQGGQSGIFKSSAQQILGGNSGSRGTSLPVIKQQAEEHQQSSSLPENISIPEPEEKKP